MAFEFIPAARLELIMNNVGHHSGQTGMLKILKFGLDGGHDRRGRKSITETARVGRHVIIYAYTHAIIAILLDQSHPVLRVIGFLIGQIFNNQAAGGHISFPGIRTDQGRIGRHGAGGEESIQLIVFSGDGLAGAG